MQPSSPSRREFLKQGSGVLIGALVFSSGPIALLAPSKVWASSFPALDEATGRALLRFARHLYPHDPWKTRLRHGGEGLDKGAADPGERSFSSTESPPSTALPAATGWRRAPIASCSRSRRSRNSVLRQGSRHLRHGALRQSAGLRPLRLRGQLLGEGRLPAAGLQRPQNGCQTRRPTPAHLFRVPAPDHRRSNMATYEMNDDSVVAVIGSGAGGGTLANELCQKGVPVVLLEAGQARIEGHFVNDEWCLVRPARLDGQAHHVRNLARGAGLPEPPGLDLQGRRGHHHPLGGRLAALPAQRVPRR